MKRILPILGLFLLASMAARGQTITLNDAVNSGCIISATNPCPRAGVNLGQASGDYPQFKNLIAFANPGFETQQVKQIFQFQGSACASATIPCTTSQFQWNVNNTQFASYLTNQWVGATFTVIQGCTNGQDASCTGGGGTSDPAFGCTGTIASNTNNAGAGPSFTTSAPCPGIIGIAGQVIVISTNSSMSNVGPPSTVGWPQMIITTTGTGSVTAENTDLCAGCGTQSAELNGGSGTASFLLRNTTFTEGSALKTITMNGNYTVEFDAKSKSGSLTGLTFNVTSRNNNCSNASGGPCPYNPTLTTGWAHYSHTFALNESASSLNAFAAGLSWAVSSGADVLLDNIQFHDASTNPTAWSDSFVTALKKLCQTAENTTGPGCAIRYGPSPDSETMANWTKSVFLSSPTEEAANSTNVQFTFNTGYFTEKPRIYDFLQLCSYLGATPVLIIPVTLTSSEAGNLVDYLEDNAGSTTYGAIRQAQGQSTAWVGQVGSPFSVIYLEFGNENWNQQFLGHALFPHSNSPNNYYDYAVRMGVVLAAARSRQGSQSYSTGATKWAANGLTGSTTDFQYLTAYECGNLTYSGGTITGCTQGAEDVIEIQQYYATSINDVSTQAALYTPSVTEPYSDIYDTTNSSAAKSFQKIPTVTSCGPSHNAACQGATYERAIYSTGNANFTQSVSDTFEQTGWHGVADAISYSESDHSGQAYITEYASQAYYLQDGGVNVHKYGVMIDAGGDCSTTNSAIFGGSYCPRPQMSAAMVENYCKIGQEKQTTGTSIPTYNLGVNNNGVAAISGVPYLTFEEYANGTNRCLLIKNSDLFSSHSVSLAGTNVPTTVTQFQLAPSSLTATNEATALNPTNTTAATVYPVLTAGVTPGSLPADSVTAWLWTTGGATSSVTVDFGRRNNTQTSVPANWQGANDMHHLDTASTTTLVGAGVKVSRVLLSLNQVWANCPSPCTPSYTAIDGQASLAVSGGYSLEVYIAYTPPDLEGGTGTQCTPPTNNATMATRAAAAIAHVDSLHPGLVKRWGVWNEPDLAVNLCPGSGTNLQAYLPIYAAMAPAMISQVSTDGQTALVGGPELGSPVANAAAWLANTSTGLLGSTTTAPYVQWVGYHNYKGGCTTTWAACLSSLQDPTTGQTAVYTSIDTLVRAGTQPNASTTPIYPDEYNDSAAFSSDPIRNDAVNGPMWNSVSVIDWLETIASGATTIPQGIFYYDAGCTGAATFFGLFGSSGGSACTPLNPYPQFYTYQLLNSPSFLNLAAGAHLAASVNPASTAAGISCTAFYTASGDALFCVNPTSTDYSAVTVTINNPGPVGALGFAYLLNSSNSTITTTPTLLTPISGGYTTTVALPAFSTIAVSQPYLPGANIVVGRTR